MRRSQAFGRSGVQAFRPIQAGLPLTLPDLNARTPERLNVVVIVLSLIGHLPFLMAALLGLLALARLV